MPVGSVSARRFAWLRRHWFWLAPLVLWIVGIPLLLDSPKAGFVVHAAPRPVPAVDFLDRDGATVSLADFREKTLLLNVWATWCPPCRREMPGLDRLQAQLGGADFAVVALSIDSNGADVVLPFYHRHGLKSLDVHLDRTSAVTTALGIVGIPTTLLIDPDVREIARVVGEADWDSAEMRALIAETIAAFRARRVSALTHAVKKSPAPLSWELHSRAMWHQTDVRRDELFGELLLLVAQRGGELSE
ncbi:MAG: TlpA family protein disulfide reductase [Alphaproteobacteria bacterium]|nr:TlpA family protein disulfide reductase [Alphaproteobacteria bacterium]